MKTIVSQPYRMNLTVYSPEDVGDIRANIERAVHGQYGDDDRVDDIEIGDEKDNGKRHFDVAMKVEGPPSELYKMEDELHSIVLDSVTDVTPTNATERETPV